MQTNVDVSGRIEASLAALNARIARLAIALNLPLNNEAALAQLMHQSMPMLDFPDRRGSAGATLSKPSADRRQAHKRDELRGLLVLRYDVQTRSLSQQGLQRTQDMVDAVEVGLLHQGFKPGADGMAHDGLLHR
jgi:hypothetical protein